MGKYEAFLYICITGVKSMIRFNKIPLFLIVCVVIMTASFGIWLLVAKDSNDEKAEIDIGQLYTVSIYGTQGAGYVDLKVNEDYFEKVCNVIDVELSVEDVKADISKENNLCNDEKFTIKFKNPKVLEDKGIKLIRKEITYTVKGLKEGTDFDVFSDLLIYIEQDKVVLDNGKCSNFVKDNVEFFIKNQLETYKEGDTVIVGAYIDMNAATDNGYNIEKKEQQYILKEQEKNND